MSEDRSVAVVEETLQGSCKHLAEIARARARRPIATHALSICACVTLDDAPNWLIYLDSDGELVWGRIPDGDDASDVVDAQLSAGGHADPGDVLAWLRGEAQDPWSGGDGWGDSAVLSELMRKIRRQAS